MKRPDQYHYSLVIEWSDEDQAYIVSFPEWSDLTHTHGDTYEEALKNGREVEMRLQENEPLPQPKTIARV